MTRPTDAVVVADAHSDLLQELAHAEHEMGDRDALRNRWLDPLARGNVALQVCAIYVDADLPRGDGLVEVLRQARSFRAGVAANPERVVDVASATDLDRLGDGRTGLLLALEGASALGENAWLIDVLADLGVRMASLTWNERNAFAAGCHHEDGLTPLGERLVERMVARGIVLDLAHASPRTFADVLSLAPPAGVVASHAACRAVHDHPRNLTDAQLEALAARGGVLGAMPHPIVVDPGRPTLERFLDHVDHAVAVMGVEHVALGGDFLRQIVRACGEAHLVYDGMPADSAIDELEGPQDYPRLAAALSTRGYGPEDVRAIMGGNLLRLLRGALPG